NGILFEIAPDRPGFAAAEDLDTRGEKGGLPPPPEPHRERRSRNPKPIHSPLAGPGAPTRLRETPAPPERQRTWPCSRGRRPVPGPIRCHPPPETLQKGPPDERSKNGRGSWYRRSGRHPR